MRKKLIDRAGVLVAVVVIFFVAMLSGIRFLKAVSLIVSCLYFGVIIVEALVLALRLILKGEE